MSTEPSEAINFYQAKNLLGNDWTAEEFALQVYFGGIRAFEKNNYETDKFRPYTNIADDWLTECFKAEIFSGEKYSIKKLLLCFNYSESELSKFKPDYRYTSYQQAITQISALTAIGNIEDADMFLIDAIEQNKITVFHPLVGTVTPELSMNGEYWRTGYFPEWKLKQLIVNEFGETETIEQQDQEPDWTTESVSGDVMEDVSKFITYFKALDYLESRLQASRDEIAQWVFFGAEEGGLNAYTMREGKPKRFNFHPRDFIGKDDYLTPLLSLYFLSDNINAFQPAKRYISRLALIERWIKPLADKEAKPIDFITARTKDSRLPEYHPICGWVEMTGELFRSGVFDLNDVLKIESEWFKAEQKENIEKSRSDSSLYEKRKISFDTWLNASPKKLDDFETVEAIFEAVKKTGDTYKYKNKNDKLLWGTECGAFTRDFWQQYRKETGYNRKKPQ